MTTTTINDNGAKANAAMRDLTLSLATSAGLTGVIIGMGIVAHTRPYASPLASWCLVAAGILGTHVAGRNVHSQSDPGVVGNIERRSKDVPQVEPESQVESRKGVDGHGTRRVDINAEQAAIFAEQGCRGGIVLD